MRDDPKPAAFVDRDGVINADLHYVGARDNFHLLPRAVEGLQRLAKCGFEIVVITNQAGIAKGLYTEYQYQELAQFMTELLESQGVTLRGIYHCPHHPEGVVKPFAILCDCRKPAPGLILRAARELGLDTSRSVLVGDKTSDAAAGRAAGVYRTVLVESGHPLRADARDHADHLCRDLADAAIWLCEHGVKP